MDLEERKQRTCKTKYRYSTRKKARASARYCQRIKGEFVEAYKCPHCQGWHIGHPNFLNYAKKLR